MIHYICNPEFESNIKRRISNFKQHARVAKLVNSLSSGGSIRKVVSRFNRDPGHKEVLIIFLVPFFVKTKARVAKLVDALSSGGSIRKVVLVRIQSRAHNLNFGGFFYAE